MKNLIMSAFAFKDGYATSLQTDKEADRSTTDMYLRNIFVALSSAKLYNSNDDVMIVTNCELPRFYQEQYEKAGILIEVVPFDSFVMPKEFPWALAFFKLCALSHMIEKEGYERILLVDGDTYTTASYEDLWKECDQGILLFPVGHTYSHPDRQIIRRDCNRLYPELMENPLHYGGEFVAGKTGALRMFINCCQDVYEKMKQADFQIENHAGDETVWSIAAELLTAKNQGRILGAGAYIYRFWTGDFYLTSTVSVSNPVCIWHIPNEKETGFIWLYQYFCKKGHFPTKEKAIAVFGMGKRKRPMNYYTFMNKVRGKLCRKN